jgi:transcriptional regulator with XRE-family HTH domain
MADGAADGTEGKSSRLHQAFADLYEQRWQANGGTLLAFSEACGISRETLRGWLAKDRIELLEHLETALAALGAEVAIKIVRKPAVEPIDRRRTTIH